MNYAGHHNVPLTEDDWRTLEFPKSEFTRDEVTPVRLSLESAIPWTMAEDSEKWYLFMDVMDLPPKYTCRFSTLHKKLRAKEISVTEHARLANLLRLEMAADAGHKQILDSVGR